MPLPLSDRLKTAEMRSLVISLKSEPITLSLISTVLIGIDRESHSIHSLSLLTKPVIALLSTVEQGSS
jgi:hypothetical protein